MLLLVELDDSVAKLSLLIRRSARATSFSLSLRARRRLQARLAPRAQTVTTRSTQSQESVPLVVEATAFGRAPTFPPPA